MDTGARWSKPSRNSATAGASIKVRGARIKLSAELYDFTDSDDELASDVALAGAL